MGKVHYRRLERAIGYSVLEIATHIDSLYMWTDDLNQQNQILSQAIAADVTYLPVRQGEQIVGLVKRKDETIGEPVSLTADWLIAVDTPILHLIELFTEKPDRIFLVLQSSKIVGLVAPADLNKVPARASIYLLIALFETSLIDLISEKLGADEQHLGQSLKAKQLNQLKNWRRLAKDKDIDLPLLHYAGLKELIDIVSKTRNLREVLLATWSEFEDNVENLVNMRNAVAHPGKPLVTSRDSLTEVNKNIHMLIDAIICIAPLLNTPNFSSSALLPI